MCNPYFNSILHVMKKSLDDLSIRESNSIHSSAQSEVRYKLIIDCSEDNSLVRLLFKHGMLRRENTRIYICGDFPGDKEATDMRV